MDELLDRAADLIVGAPPLVVLTGAGVSTESGIPDFRGPTGLWARYDPKDFSYPAFLGSVTGRQRYWSVGRELYASIREARPNAAHRALVALDALGLLDCVVTQNVDDLHQRAGLPPGKVIELHGNATRVRCLDCAATVTRDHVQERLLAGETVPDCRACGGILKPHTVLFGEPMPARELALARERARGAGTFLVVGSSLIVYPAAYLPFHAREGGARLLVVNLTPTSLDRQADVVIAAPAGEVMPRLAERVRIRLGARPEGRQPCDSTSWASS